MMKYVLQTPGLADMETCDKCGQRFDELTQGGTCQECDACICDDCIGGFEDQTTAYDRGNNQNQQSLHPTQKPFALMEWLVKTYTHECDMVLDPFMGSGTTGVACAIHNRRFIGIEKEPEYFNTAAERINKAYQNG